MDTPQCGRFPVLTGITPGVHHCYFTDNHENTCLA
jgi:hypothetical protein